jgi:alkylation response protein AidB-like acyl-CoA dehydrogenase
MTTSTPDELLEIRRAVGELCDRFPGEYWRSLEPDRYPEEFVQALTEHGWLAALIPEEYGGAGLGLTAASVILEEVNASGGNAAACHAQMYTMGTLLRHGSEQQKQRYLPRIASGELRLQAFGVTEPTVGSDTTRLQTSARRVDGGYVIRGQKIWTSRALHSDLMLLLARTTPFEEVERKSDGISVFLIDMKAAGERLSIRPVATMMNHATTEVFLDDVEVPADALVGEEGEGFRYILDGMNAERILLAAECIGDGRWFTEGRTRCVGARRLRPADRRQPGRSVPDCARLRRDRGRRPRPLPRRIALRAGAAMRRRGEHGQAARVGGVVAGGERLPRHARRLRVRAGVRRRTEVPRDTSLLRRTGFEQPRSRVSRPPRARAATLVLSIQRLDRRQSAIRTR